VNSPDILGVILAGGASRRFGADKAAAVLGGVSLLERTVARARPQVADLAISAARHVPSELPVIVDRVAGQGPLTGILSSLGWAAEQGFGLIATFPCDAPFFPMNLVARLTAASGDGDDCAIARRGEDGQYAFALWRTSCEPRLARAFAAGVRSLHKAAAMVNCIHVDFPIDGDGPDGNAFFNINRPKDLASAEEWLKQR
jgi:molybdenum cofactor guanylyltransferase